MAAIATGGLYSDEEVSKMSKEELNKLQIVPINSEEQKKLAGMSNRKERRAWLKANKKFKKY